jgi:dCMP deaminase
VQGALYGVSLEGATAYCTHQPCINCAKLLISAGVVRIVYDAAYPDPFAQEMLAEAGVALVPFASLERPRANVGSS